MRNPNSEQFIASFGLILVFAIAGGAAVGNLYWSQPLLAEISSSLGVPMGSAGLLVTVTQIGYAIGVVSFVPLGDILNRRILIPTMMTLSSMALVACALAPNFTFLLFSLAALGFTTVAGQLLVPLAGDLARNDLRGRMVGLVASGLVTGILLSRAIGGLIANQFGWRAVYFIAAIVTLSLALMLRRALPSLPPRSVLPYRQLLGSILAVVRQHRAVQVTLLLGSIFFSVLLMFWTGVTFLLSSAPYSFNVSQIGLVSLAGIAGVIAAQRAGWLHDHGWSVASTGAAFMLILISLALTRIFADSIYVLLAVVVLLDMAIQAGIVLSQTRLFAVDNSARSRLNTAFWVSNFIGGAIGSYLAVLFWEHGGWPTLTLGAAGAVGFGLIVWFFCRSILRAVHSN